MRFEPSRTGAAALLAGVLFATPAAAKEVQLERDGLTLNANLELAEGKTLSDGLVLMTHGTLAHGGMEIMASLQDVLKESGYNSLSINLSLGQSDRRGMYDCAARHMHKHTDALDEIGAWLDWAKGEGAGDIVLLGHSRGGNQTAWYAAEREMTGVKGVVLVAPGTWDAQREYAGYAARYGTELQPLLEKAGKLVEQGKGDTVLEQVDFVYCEATEVTAASFLNYYEDDARKDTPTLLPRIEVPVLVIAGSEDTVVQELPEKVEPLADGEKISFVMIDGAEHFFRDLYTYDIVESVETFIEGL